MSEQRYPFFIRIYKGEGRILIDPLINHFYGYSVESGSYSIIEDMENCIILGNSILKMADIIKNSPLSRVTPKEREEQAVWKKNSKYKSWNSFWKNNNYARVMIYEDGRYEIYSMKHSEKHKGNYGEIIEKFDLPSSSNIEEIGKAIIKVFKAAEEYYKDNKFIFDPYPSKNLELLDGSTLTVKQPHDKHFNDFEDCSAAEIYQCYSYLPQEDADSSADFFIGIAPELDCDLSIENIKSSWEEVYEKAESFDIQETNYGIFKLRAEMRNKACHKVSYFLQMEEDLILECGMDVHQPNRRKKLDERLADIFKEFAINCKL